MKLTSPSSSSSRSRHSTEQQLIHAAGQTFSRLGYHGATIRGICELAHANIAAINYHFGGKKQLYIATLRYACDGIVSSQPLWSSQSQDEVDAEVRLRTFVRGLLLRQTSRHRIPWFGKLILREMMEPTGMLKPLMEQSFRPEMEFLMNIVRELLGPAKSQNAHQVQSCAMSILGQCLFCAGPGSRLVLQYMSRFDAPNVGQLTDHITEFSLMAIGQIRHSLRR